MKISLALTLCLFSSILPLVYSGEETDINDLSLWYDEPAGFWEAALPIGNGRLGAMVFGGISEERIQFNEDTVWQGKPHEYQQPEANNLLPTIRQQLFE